ncbi:MAG: hypothetical protein R3F35_09515 [Myxococcota bacterium]
MRVVGATVALVLALVGSLVDGPAAVAQTAASPLWLTVEETESLVRRIDYEGMPRAEAERIGPAGAARLVEMLADPAERTHHARVLLALGTCGAPGALEAIRAWAASAPRAGELDRARFRAWQMLPHALGRLASHDPRAVEELVARFDAGPPAWTFRHFRGNRLQRLERRAAVSALGESDRPEAARALEGLMRRGLDPELADHVRAARAAMAVPTTGGTR